ncbi:MAG: cytochrome c peroxidase [Gammaproteobacteria bacterium]
MRWTGDVSAGCDQTMGRRWRASAALSLALTAVVVLADQAPSSTRADDSHEPISPLPLTVAVDPARVALGERLFNDVRLSHDNDMSCATCHLLQNGGGDGLPRSKTAAGTVLARNAPTLFNLAFSFSFNWDGVADSLEAHADRLLQNPKVMNTNWSELLVRLSADRGYVQAFAALYPDSLNKANVLNAIANYERSLVTPNARFDRFLRGERAALSAAEQQGYALFAAYGCVACHQGVNIGANMYQKFGVFEDVLTPPAAGATADPGRYNVTKVERDRGVFRVPSLRNVALTAPYFHDGRAATLEVAVETMARVQLGRKLSAEEIGLIVQFLHTLTGEYRAQPVAAAVSAAR